MVSVLFQILVGRRSENDKGQINRWIGIVSRFKVKLVTMVKDVSGEFDDYSILPKIKQILLHWGCESTEKKYFINSTN